MNEKIIIEKTIQIFEQKNFRGYDKDDNNWSVTFTKNQKLLNGNLKNVYSVSFWSSKLFFSDNENDYDRRLYFAIMDVESMEIYFIITPHGYIYLDDE